MRQREREREIFNSTLYLPGNRIEIRIPRRINYLAIQLHDRSPTGAECANGIAIVISPWPENSFDARARGGTVLAGAHIPASRGIPWISTVVKSDDIEYPLFHRP